MPYFSACPIRASSASAILRRRFATGESPPRSRQNATSAPHRVSIAPDSSADSAGSAEYTAADGSPSPRSAATKRHTAHTPIPSGWMCEPACRVSSSRIRSPQKSHFFKNITGCIRSIQISRHRQKKRIAVNSFQSCRQASFYILFHYKYSGNFSCVSERRTKGVFSVADILTRYFICPSATEKTSSALSARDRGDFRPVK